nr:MAG TPA: zinc-ribbon domain protein [Caudoviricetes sp.]
MFCPNCGKEIADGSKFCQHCGFQIVVDEAEKREKTLEEEGLINKIADKVCEKNKKQNSGCSGCLTALGIIVVICCFLPVIDQDFNPTSTTNNGKSSSLEVTESHSCNLGYGARGICGTVKNNSNRNIGYAQVEINLYDKSGNIIDSTFDNVNNIEAGATWKFQAPIINDNVATYSVKNVTGF